MPRHLLILPDPADLGTGTPDATTVLDGTGAWTALASIGPAGATGTKTFYAAASSGGAVTTLNTVVIVNGRIITWTQTVSGGGGIDTASKRGSAIHTLGVFVAAYPIPDGTIDQTDRQHVGGSYSGILA